MVASDEKSRDTGCLRQLRRSIEVMPPAPSPIEQIPQGTPESPAQCGMAAAVIVTGNTTVRLAGGSAAGTKKSADCAALLHNSDAENHRAAAARRSRQLPTSITW